MRAVLLALPLLATLALAGCSGQDDPYTGSVRDGIRVVDIHIGWSDDRQSQYFRPGEIHVRQGDKVQFRVTNDDDPSVDYNGDKSGRDNFHDVALLGYDADGDGDLDDIEHEVPAGRTTVTNVDGQPYFIATTAGTFDIFCEVRTTPTHAALGMQGLLVVAAA